MSLLVVSAAASAAEQAVEPFTLESVFDGAAIDGQIDWPESGEEGAPIVLMVPGTGPWDRDVRIGRTGGENDFIFRAIAGELNRRGIATARYDKRIFGCYADNSCEAAALSVSPASERADIDTLVDWLAERAAPQCLAIVAHSEGTIHAAAVLEEDAGARVGGFLGLGAVLTSPKEVFRWQSVDRIPDSMAMLDADGDGSVTRAELEEGLARTPAYVLISAGGASYDDFIREGQSFFLLVGLPIHRANWRRVYGAQRADARSHAAADLYSEGGVPYASYAWRKMWFDDDVSIASRLAAFPGPIRFIYGALDSQTAPDHQTPELEAFPADADVRTAVLPDLGHSLGRDVFLGPIEPEGLAQIGEDVKSIFQATGCSSM